MNDNDYANCNKTCLFTNKPKTQKEMFGLCVGVGLVVIGVLCYHYCFGVSSCRNPINAATHVSMLLHAYIAPPSKES